MEQYQNLIKDVLENGTRREDRTGTGTISLFGTQTRYDLREGFPLVTVKKMHFRGIVEELIWFLRGQGNIDYLLSKDVFIWNEWSSSEGEVGRLYPVQWRSWNPPRRIIEITSLNDISEKSKIGFIPFDLLTPVISVNSLIGKKFKSNSSGEFIVLNFSKEKGLNNRTLYDVQFLETGFVKTGITKTNIRGGNIKDPYRLNFYGVGRLGEISPYQNDVTASLYRRWLNMLNRCYNSDYKEFYLYGQKGISVCPRWLVFSNYYEDVQRLPNWENARKNLTLYCLDKDYYGSNIYSPDTCVWLTQGDNSLYSSSKPFWLIDSEGNKHLEISQMEAASKWNLSNKKISLCLLNKKKTHKGFSFRYLTREEVGDKLFRYELPIDQIDRVINSIKKDPYSRRHIVSAWNVADLSEMNLPPCHTFFQFYVKDNELSCHLYQRSGDCFLGIPYNVACYSLLTHIIAKLTGLEIGEFIHTIGDAHLYLNHIDQAKEILLRDPKKLPTLSLDEFDCIDDFSWEHVNLENYEYHPAIQAEVAV